MDGASGEPWTAGLDGSPRVPKYYRLKEDLRGEIRQLPAGTAIETERVLSARFGVSRTTVRQALQELTVEGLVERFQGRGTFVARPKFTQVLQLTSYTEDMAATGRRATSWLLEASVVPATADVAEPLGLVAGAPAQRLKRLRLADAEPMALEVVWLDAERFAGLGNAMTGGTSLYRLLSEVYGVELSRAQETIETVLASPVEAGLLETGTGSPLLRLTRTSWDEDSRPVEHVRSLYRGDRFRFVADLLRPDGERMARRFAPSASSTHPGGDHVVEAGS